jgi:hypothetical protein
LSASRRFEVTFKVLLFLALDTGVTTADENRLLPPYILLLLLPIELVSSSYINYAWLKISKFLNLATGWHNLTYMYFQMCPEVTRLGKRSFAFVTLVRFFSGVSPHMDFQST